MAWSRVPEPPTESEAPQSAPTPPPSGNRLATLGPSISIKGNLSGKEDLLIEGRVEGEISLRKHSVTIGSSGKVKADIYSKSICVEGEIIGNLYGSEEVIIRQSGRVEGNAVAPKVTLENGANFRGSIDMQPQGDQETSAEGPDRSSKPSQPPEVPNQKGRRRSEASSSQAAEWKGRRTS